ncbi:uncharacterized protein LOC119891591 [Micropterus salmoides]|uniref:uncharacterized protein LOC119891591 n=1 Tax=Micropterus salmoides TaxID=27706 RepID=UPI0018ECA4DF|nr:uncharacterized protein LOC119891591 [Micropterus salmoides]
MWGKANIIKMICAPKFNYLLQAMPVRIPLRYFKQFDQLCNTFLWNNKRPRMNLRKLQRPVDKGGLGVPNLLFYHYAFTIRHMAQWSLPPERAPPWFHLESAVSSPLTPIACISAKLAQQYQSHPILSHIQWVWKRVAKILKFDPYLHQAAGIWLNPKLCINKSPFLWKLWLQKGIRVLGDLYQDGTLKSFEALSQEFDLPRNQQWKYLHTIVEKIVEQNIPLTPSLFILGDPSALSDLAPPLSNWIQTVLMLGRKLVVKEWKAPSAPALDLWYATLGQLAALEHLSYRLLDKVEEYNLKWGKFHSYTLKV